MQLKPKTAHPRNGAMRCGSFPPTASCVSNSLTHPPQNIPSHTTPTDAIHGGPMAGRINYQTCTYQCIRPGELWQCNWLEETGTICSLVYDIKNSTITTLIAFSKGHWNNAKEARGDKRDAEVFDRWRGLAKQGTQVERYMLSEQAKIAEKFKGKGDLVPIEEDAETF
jgi:hypothetical protein